jgi:hypothetical protein
MKQVDYVRMAEKCAREADRMPPGPERDMSEITVLTETTQQARPRAAARAYSHGLRLTIRPAAENGLRLSRRSTPSGVSAHFFRTICSGGNGLPSLLARVRTTSFLRPKAEAARRTDAPLVANAFRRSSS